MALDLELSKITISLQADEKTRRKQALEEIIENISREKTSSRVDVLARIWESVHRYLVRILNDKAEICRDLTVGILRIFLEALPPDDKHIIYIIPIMSRRLGVQEQIEPSEEVRLKYVSFLRVIILKYKDLLAPYIPDITAIVTHTVTDSYPNVKKESCKCISDYVKTLPRHLYSQSEHLIKPILSNFTHQHYRVRLAAVETIGDVIRYGNSKSMEEVATSLAQRLFDQSGIVRKAVVQVSGHWLTELPDRYSWWYKILPLIMTGMHDELPEIRVKAAEMWDAAGKLYMEENMNDSKLKDKMDFLTEDPEHYPPDISRPNLGCRMIAQQNLCRLICGIAVELGDWLPDIRVRSAQLLCVLILNVEEDVTQHIEKLLPSMYRACNDKDERVVRCVETAARYLGYFVEPGTYCQLVLPTVEESPTAGHLRVLAAIISGSERKALSPQLGTIANFLQQPHICRSKKTNYQRQLLSCCNSLFMVCEEDCAAVTQSLFVAIFTTYAMSMEASIREETDRLLRILVDINSLKDVEDLFCDHMESLITSIREDCASWSVYSAESQIFGACLSRAGVVVVRNVDLVSSVLERTMAEDAEPELKLRHFILLSEYLSSNRDLRRRVDEAQTRRFVSTIIEKLVAPGLVWAAGRAAEATRTAAVCCLCAILQNEISDKAVPSIDAPTKCDISITAEQFSSILDKVLPVLLSLLDDRARKTRLYSICAICSIVIIGRKLSHLTDEHIHRVHLVILRRLDDGCDDVRYAAVEALMEVWNAVSENYDIVIGRSHIDALYTTMIVHLDDPESNFRLVIFDALKRVAKISPELLYQKLHSCRSNFRNAVGIDALLEHCQEMSDSTGDHVDALEEELEVDSNYKPPPEKTIEQILETDKEDESLRKYKETLLGEAKAGGVVVDPNDPRKVIVKKLALCVAERPDMELDLSGDLGQLKKQTFVIKEGVSYRIRIDFIVQREIVHGLKYIQKTYRLGVPVDKMTHMVGSYPPKTELQSYTTPAEDAPAGVMARGSYSVSSLFTDDDKHEHLKWEWAFEIKKDWKE
ncbi:dynein assembly factor 5, axonemal isoform X2 [Odontomachus brunneus]|uniref:dynein assembly factor 5, axonemal isoform X2 n=2 Tax=Odontomachus brunneus TaxID=486640 RepID=UPI0013F1B812|nr:dynein assembly factor 5, axonemal isoform X2 [Odontomachus brunneus]